MKVLTTAPYNIVTGRTVTPTGLNAVFGYPKAALDEVTSKRWCIETLPLHFVPSLNASFAPTESSSTEHRTIRFTPRDTMIVDRAFLTANLVSTGEVVANITDAAGFTVSGATTPWLTTSAAQASAAVDVTDIATERFTLTAGTTYLVTVSATTGTFLLSRFDIVMHVRVDRWGGSVPTVAAPNFTDASMRDASAVAALQSAYQASMALALTGISGLPVMFTVPRLSSGMLLTPELRTIPFPAASAGTTKAVLRQLELVVAPQNSGSTTITVDVLNGAGTVFATTSVTYASTTAAQTSLVSTATTLTGTTVGAAADSAQDYSVRFTSNNATPCHKAYAILTFARS